MPDPGQTLCMLDISHTAQRSFLPSKAKGATFCSKITFTFFLFPAKYCLVDFYIPAGDIIDVIISMLLLLVVAVIIMIIIRRRIIKRS